ncbi:uncharacterized protein LOC133205344 isoform X2 [Saccostrea echinata]|uniref:uncharacterized protein LOC133205344 isoform X2 n=1 Tax=Saccostrea echinata TaxID=191078 RepID=UPI002A7F5EA7|nr:uncharacterized protein LOC133205344 isoform X2 [Saccostrea echinata]
MIRLSNVEKCTSAIFRSMSAVVCCVLAESTRHTSRSLERKDSTNIRDNKLYSVTGNNLVNETIYSNVGYIPDIIPDLDRQVAPRNYKYDYVRRIDWDHLMGAEQKMQQITQNKLCPQETYVNTSEKYGRGDSEDDSKQYHNIFSENKSIERTKEEYTDVVTELEHCKMHHSYVEMSEENDMGLYNKLNHGTRSVRRTEVEDITYSHIQPESEGEYTILCGGEVLDIKIYENQPEKWSSQP